jgi:hypothetical protein
VNVVNVVNVVNAHKYVDCSVLKFGIIRQEPLYLQYRLSEIRKTC